MKKDPKIFIEHILQSIEIIEGHIENKTEKDFSDSVLLQDAIIRRIEIIGEAAKNLPSDFKEEHHDIPWKTIAGMRDILIHKYFGIDLELTWEVVKRDIPALKEQILEINEELV